jgi:retron-type reverse transcriptase
LIRSITGKTFRGGAFHRKRFTHTYEDIISVENLLCAWREFVKGKRSKKDVQEFQYALMDNILALHRDLKARTYRHGTYEAFKVNDPKPRDIHKATVSDRLLHHALYRKLYPFFDTTFFSDSYSCRRGKGTHRAIRQFKSYAYTVSQNHTRTGYVLKCDIKKFFASIDHRILIGIIQRRIVDRRIVTLMQNIVTSHTVSKDYPYSKLGLPLGSLTSQLLVNIYMNEFDQYVKHALKARCYIRYADDFVILDQDKKVLEKFLVKMRQFLEEKLSLTLHPCKVSIRTISSGVDFFGMGAFSRSQSASQQYETENDA